MPRTPSNKHLSHTIEPSWWLITDGVSQRNLEDLELAQDIKSRIVERVLDCGAGKIWFLGDYVLAAFAWGSRAQYRDPGR